MQLLQPIWLFVMSCIIVPVLIHWWKTRQGKVLRVGSVMLMDKQARQQSSKKKLSQWWLLLLRCLLIIIAAILLAQPVWKKSNNDNSIKGWVLLPRKNLEETYNHFKQPIDSLLENSWELHYWEKGFEKANLKDSADAEKTESGQENYWTLLSAVHGNAPAELPLVIFTDDQLRKFRGSKPSVSRPVSWYSYTMPDSVAEWNAYTWPLSSDSMLQISARSSPSAVEYHRNIIPVKADLPTDSSTLLICIYREKHPADADYIAAAVNAIKNFTKRRIRLQQVNNRDEIPAQADWLFWLSDELPADGFTAVNTLVYTTGQEINYHSWLITGKNQPLNERINIYKKVNVPAEGTDNIIWKDAFEKPLLWSLNKGNKSVYSLGTHFDPSWSELVWNEKFPEVLLALIYQQNDSNLKYQDTRSIDQQQLKTIPLAGRPPVIEKDSFLSLSNLCWILAFLLFLTERIVSFKTFTR
jgi:hypothetical protein